MQMEIFLLIIALVLGLVSFLKISDLTGRIEFLTLELNDLRSKLYKLMSAQQEAVIRESVTQEQSVTPITPVPLPSQSPTPEPAKVEIPVIKPIEIFAPVIPPIEQPTVVPTPPPTRVRYQEPTKTKEEWEALVGGKLLNRVGALALIVGIGFFLKYAFDNNWISETVRVLMGFGAGLGLLFGAFRSFKKDYKIFAQGLVGAGIATLYLSIYASFNYYHLIPQVVAFGLMSVVTAVTFLQALKYDSRAVSLLGLIGGFLTPIMLSTGHPNEIGLFTYVALLDVGILAVVLIKEDWIMLEPLSLLGTYFYYFAWYASNYQDVATANTESNFIPTVFFLTVFWLMYFGTHFWRQYKNTIKYLELQSFLSALVALLFYVNLYVVMEQSHHEYTGAVTLLIGVVYFGSSLILRKKNGEQYASVAHNIVTSIILLVIATAVQYKGLTIAGLWSVEALALLLCARKWNMRYIWKIALMIYGLALVQLLIPSDSLKIDNYENFLPVLNRRMFIYVIFIISSFGGAIVFRDDDEQTTYTVKSIFHYVWASILLLLCIIEVNDFFGRMLYLNNLLFSSVIHFWKILSIASITMVYGIGILYFGLKNKLEPVVKTALVGTTTSIVLAIIGGTNFEPISDFIPIWNIRMDVLVFIIGGIFTHIFLIKKYEHECMFMNIFLTHLRKRILHYVWAIILLILCYIETHNFFGRLYFNQSIISNSVQNFRESLAIASVMMVYAVGMFFTGLKKKIEPVTQLSLVGMSISLLITIIGGINYVPIEQFILVFNVRLAVTLLVLCGVIIHIRLLKDNTNEYGWLKHFLPIFQIAVVVLIFFMLTTEVIDVFNRKTFYSSTSSERTEISNMMQMSLSIVWLLYSIALMGIGIWKQYRGLRLVSIILFGFTILKIFIYDLSFLQTLYRIFSFIGLGLILLLVSYLYQRYKELIFGKPTE